MYWYLIFVMYFADWTHGRSWKHILKELIVFVGVAASTLPVTIPRRLGRMIVEILLFVLV